MARTYGAPYKLLVPETVVFAQALSRAGLNVCFRGAPGRYSL